MKKNDVAIEKFISEETITKKIYMIRGKKVMLDQDLADLYEVETKQLTRQVRRNIERFPQDFMFQLTPHESLRCQFGTSKRGGRRYLPYAFTEQGIAMLSSILRSRRAILVNIQIMRAFVVLKRLSLTYTALRHKIDEMEKKYDSQFRVVFEAIRQIMTESEKPRRRIGFHAG